MTQTAPAAANKGAATTVAVPRFARSGARGFTSDTLAGVTMPLAAVFARALDEAFSRSGPAVLTSDADVIPAEQCFHSALLAFSERFGEPDWPGDDYDWPSALGLGDIGALAIWDFDYYTLSLRVDGTQVLIERHENG